MKFSKKFLGISTVLALAITLLVPVPRANSSGLTLTFETPSNAVVVLGSLASRTQRKAITVGGATAPYTVTGTDSRGGTYQYLTDVNYSSVGAGSNRESDERGFGSFSFGSTASMTYSGRSNVMYLNSGGSCNSGNTFDGLTSYCAVFGPEVWTQPFDATAGQALSFDYAASASDNYEVYAFLVKVSEKPSPASPGTYDYGGAKVGDVTNDPLATHTLVLHRRGKTTTWTTASGSVPETGKYRFRFVDGAFDATGGYALGTDFYIDPASVTVGNGQTITFANPGDQIGASNGTFDLTATSSSGLSVTFTSSTSGTCTVSGVTVTKVSTGTCTITANAAGGTFGSTTYVAAASVSRSFQIRASAVAPDNTGLPSIFGTASSGTTLTIDEGTWDDGGAAITGTTYQWISRISGVDSNISGATSNTFCIPSSLVGATIKVAVTKTNSVGSTTETSNATSAVTLGTECSAPTPTPTPTVNSGGTAATPTATPTPTPTPTRTTAPIVRNTPILSGPVNTGTNVNRLGNTPQTLIGGVPTNTTTRVVDPTKLNLLAGALNLEIQVPQNVGSVTNNGGTTQLQVQKGGITTINGSGLRPLSTVQVFLPLGGNNSRELARIPVTSSGTFNGLATFANPTQGAPLPIGPQVLQIVSVDPVGRQAVVEMKVNIAQPAPAPEQNRQNGQLPDLNPGQSIATEAGVPVPVIVEAIEQQRQAIIQGDTWNMSINVPNANGQVTKTDGGALLKFIQNGTVFVEGDGFLPGTRADVWLFSDPTLLGTVEIDENGKFAGQIAVDGKFVPTGEHTLQVQGVGDDGFVRSANLGVVVEANTISANSLLNSTWFYALLGVGLAAITTFFALARRRRKEAKHT